MTTKKQKAIALRKQGKTYSEILAEVSVAKSTLSGWLTSVGLTTPQKQAITAKKRASALRGALARHTTRMKEVHHYLTSGTKEVAHLSSRELWLIGTALYWAEGSKQKDSNPSVGVMFSNSDARMIQAFLCWLQLLKIPATDIQFELYVHVSRKSDTPAFRRWWAKQLALPVSRFNRVYFKQGNPKTNRTNITDLYHGLLRIRVKSSTVLNRQIDGWVVGIVASLGSGVTGNTPAFGAGDSRIVP